MKGIFTTTDMHTWRRTRQPIWNSWRTLPRGSKNKTSDRDGGSKTVMSVKQRVHSIERTLAPQPVIATPYRRGASIHPEDTKGHGMTAGRGLQTGTRITDHPLGGGRKDGVLAIEDGGRTHGRALSGSEQESGRRNRETGKMKGRRRLVQTKCTASTHRSS